MAEDTITVYCSIGNTDDKLPQAEWAEYVDDFRVIMRAHAFRVLGEWYSLPDSAHQNACIAITTPVHGVYALREELINTRETFDPASLAWAVVPDTEFI